MGPDLTLIGSSRSLRHLREAMINPDADVRQRYWRATGVATDGKPVSGFLLNEDTYTAQVIDDAGALRSIDKAATTAYNISQKSKMPGFAQLPAAELDDLVAYLNSLRRPGGSR